MCCDSSYMMFVNENSVCISLLVSYFDCYGASVAKLSQRWMQRRLCGGAFPVEVLSALDQA